MDFAGLLLAQAAQSEGEGDLAAAEMFYRGLLKDFPGHPQGRLRLGLLLYRSGSTEEGLDCLRQAADAAPRWPQAHLELGKALHGLGRNDEAMAAYLLAACVQAAAVDPAEAQAHFNLGMAFSQAQRDADAAAAFAQALTARPQFAEAYNNLGISLHNLSRLTEAVAAHRHAASLAPGNAGFHSNLAHALLASGALEEGFREWEWRTPSPPRDFRQPLWDGSAFPDQVLLVHAEQGYGDTLQFCRYIPQVARLGGRLLVECRRPMAGLLGRLDGVAEVVKWGQPLPPFDLQIPVPSLAHACRTTRDTVPAASPYLRPDGERLALWRQRVAAPAGLKVGLVWAGNVNRGDPRRAIALADLLPLAGQPGIHLFSLQREGIEDLAGVDGIVGLGHLVEDFDDMAAAISHLDLLISVDTAAAHLAGALGKPVWTLLRFSPDWRWEMEPTTTPWYPTMRLYRQSRPGQWTDVVERVAADLRLLIGES